MDLTTQQQAAFDAHFKKVGKLPLCPLCQNDKWKTGPTESGMPFFKGAIQTVGSTVPVIQLICTKCAFVAGFALEEMSFPT